MQHSGPSLTPLFLILLSQAVAVAVAVALVLLVAVPGVCVLEPLHSLLVPIQSL